MKITKSLRIFLILLSVMMVLPLFACGDNPEETTTKAPEATTAPNEGETTADETDATTKEPDAEITTDAPVVDDTTDAPVADDTTEAETTEAESTDATTESGSETTETGSESSEATETTEAPACEHVEKTVDAVAPTCTETGLTEGKVCELCGAVLVAQTVVPASHTLTDVAAVAATCTEDGIVAHKHCSVCEKNFDAEGNELTSVVDPATGHTAETVAAVAATCVAKGNEEYKKCACGAMWTADGETVIDAVPETAIDPTAHKTVDKAYMAPTTAEAGWEAHTICELCEQVWDAEGEELDAVPALAKIVPETNKYWGVEALSTMIVGGATGSLFNPPAISDDRSYVRFSRGGASNDGFINFMASNTAVTGKYVVFKYRTDHSTSGEFWANTTENGHSGGKSSFIAAFISDESWHIVVYDLAANIGNYVKADDDGTYTIQWARIDMLNDNAEAGYFDIAYIALCDDLSKVTSIMQDGDTELCPHFTAETSTYTNEGDNHSTECVICGEKIYENHSAANDATWSSENKAYTGTCVCGAEVLSDMIYKTESYSTGSADSTSNFLTVTKKDGFIRYTAGVTDKTDLYFYPYRNGTAVTGKYMVIKYRVSNNGVDLGTGQKFASSAASGASAGATGSNQNFVTPDIWIADGNWHTMIIHPKAENVSFTPNEDGTYSWGYLRLNVNGITPGGYVDIAEIAFADNQEAAEYYAHNNDATPPFRYNFDQGNNLINETSFLSKSMQAYGCLTVDMSTCAALTTPTSLKLGGWTCTPGGVDAYYIRVTKINGETVFEPVLVKWQDGNDRLDDIGPVGVGLGFTTDSGLGAGFNKNVVDLTAYAGRTIDFELVAVTNYGATVVFGNFLNLAVPEAPAAQ